MDLKVAGRITNILEVETGETKAGKEWKKQSFVVDSGDQYNPDICFSLFGQKKIDLIKDRAIGEDVTVSFNVSSREFNKKWYHNIDAWKVELQEEKKDGEPDPALGF